MEKGGKIWYYLYDGHGSIRLLTNEAGCITGHYAYDAYGNLLQKEGNTENDFLYTGEQYNANPVMYTNPSGYSATLREETVAAAGLALVVSGIMIYDAMIMRMFQNLRLNLEVS